MRLPCRFTPPALPPLSYNATLFSMEYNKRSVNCGELKLKHTETTVTLNGWVHRNRNHGGVQFMDIRDRYGMTQAVVDDSAPAELKNLAAGLKMECCVSAIGIVRARPKSMINKNIPTGHVELVLTDLQILNNCPALPFMIDGEEDVNENLRLKYRYLDLRTSAMQRRILMRHRIAKMVREYLDSKDFLEVETPTFIKSTPEGARDYLVPSRMYPGSFYALPQSPQLYKQLLMVGGLDRYYQMARCYRDEDARGDRQPEFTQIDLEMSFAGREDVIGVIEELMSHVWFNTLALHIAAPFPRFSWHEAMDTFGVDKPDLRFAMSLQDFSPFVAGSEFSVFKTVLESGGTVKALVAKGAAEFLSRKKIGDLEEEARKKGARGLAWMKVSPDGLDGGVAKFFQNQSKAISDALEAEPGDVILMSGGEWSMAVQSLGAVRVKLAWDLNLIDPEDIRFCWVQDFPLFEEDEETGGWKPAHHMFSMPQEQYLDTMEENPGQVLGNLYDLVLNGNELGSGSVRIHDPAIQSRVFDLVGFPREEAGKRFGFLLEALQYGAPPHAGFAIGFDRLVMLMTKAENLREVLAFPKNSQCLSPMDGCPSTVDSEQLTDLHLKILEKE